MNIMNTMSMIGLMRMVRITRMMSIIKKVVNWVVQNVKNAQEIREWRSEKPKERGKTREGERYLYPSRALVIRFIQIKPFHVAVVDNISWFKRIMILLVGQWLSKVSRTFQARYCNVNIWMAGRTCGGAIGIANKPCGSTWLLRHEYLIS